MVDSVSLLVFYFVQHLVFTHADFEGDVKNLISYYAIMLLEFVLLVCMVC